MLRLERAGETAPQPESSAPGRLPMPGPPPREEATEAPETDAHHRGAAAPGSSPAPSAAGTPPRAQLPGEQPTGDARSYRVPVASACPADAALGSPVALHPPPL